MTAKGIDFVLYAIHEEFGKQENVKIAGQKGASIAMSVGNTQLSAGGYAFNILSTHSWGISAEQLLSFNDDSFDYLMHHYQLRKPVLIKFAYQKTTHKQACSKETETGSTEALVHYEGYAHITDISINANAGDIMSYSIDLAGHHQLKKYKNNELVEW